jgi:hypothetical protein
LDEKCVKKAKFDVISNPMIQKILLQSALFVLQFVLWVPQFEALFDFLLYTKCVVVLLMPLLTTL